MTVADLIENPDKYELVPMRLVIGGVDVLDDWEIEKAHFFAIGLKRAQ